MKPFSLLFLTEDIDECAGPNECSKTHGKCVDTPGGYHCRCRVGYEDPPNCQEGLYLVFS